MIGARLALGRTDGVASVATSSAGIAMTRPGRQSLSRRRPLAELIASTRGRSAGSIQALSSM